MLVWFNGFVDVRFPEFVCVCTFTYDFRHMVKCYSQEIWLLFEWCSRFYVSAEHLHVSRKWLLTKFMNSGKICFDSSVIINHILVAFSEFFFPVLLLVGGSESKPKFHPHPTMVSLAAAHTVGFPQRCFNVIWSDRTIFNRSTISNNRRRNNETNLSHVMRCAMRPAIKTKEPKESQNHNVSMFNVSVFPMPMSMFFFSFLERQCQNGTAASHYHHFNMSKCTIDFTGSDFSLFFLHQLFVVQCV